MLPKMVIAQISDFHLGPRGHLLEGKVDTNHMLERAVDHLNRLDPPVDVVLATGDLAERGGRDSEYEVLKEIFARLRMPVYLIPGNHDDRERIRQEFSHCSYLPADGEFLHYVVEDYPVRLICLDSTIPGEDGGVMCERRLAWLEARLQEARERPTIVAIHHPPFPCGLPHMDWQRLDNAEAFGAVIARHPQVERVLCGHVHRPVQTRWYGTIASIAPTPAHQIPLDLREDAPSAFNLEPAACYLHVWYEGTGLVTHMSYIGEYPGPYLYARDPRDQKSGRSREPIGS